MFPLGCNSARLTASETDAILTIFDQDFRYSKARTFALAAEITDLCLLSSEMNQSAGGGAGGEGGSAEPPFNSELCTRHDTSIDDEILGTIGDQMVQIGYEQVKSAADADVVVLVSAVARDYWYYAGGYVICDELLGDECWDPGGGYPYALPYGSLLLTWIDGESLPDGSLESAWLATIPGVFGTYAPRGNIADFDIALRQAFRQSPYLEVKP
jgi:hypothetical protein